MINANRAIDTAVVQLAMRRACPRCGAPAGVPCLRNGRVTESCLRQRHEAQTFEEGDQARPERVA